MLPAAASFADASRVERSIFSAFFSTDGQSSGPTLVRTPWRPIALTTCPSPAYPQKNETIVLLPLNARTFSSGPVIGLYSYTCTTPAAVTAPRRAPSRLHRIIDKGPSTDGTSSGSGVVVHTPLLSTMGTAVPATASNRSLTFGLQSMENFSTESGVIDFFTIFRLSISFPFESNRTINPSQNEAATLPVRGQVRTHLTPPCGEAAVFISPAPPLDRARLTDNIFPSSVPTNSFVFNRPLRPKHTDRIPNRGEVKILIALTGSVDGADGVLMTYSSAPSSEGDSAHAVTVPSRAMAEAMMDPSIDTAERAEEGLLVHSPFALRTKKT